jgi:hypothetical protein
MSKTTKAPTALGPETGLGDQPATTFKPKKGDALAIQAMIDDQRRAEKIKAVLATDNNNAAAFAEQAKSEAMQLAAINAVPGKRPARVISADAPEAVAPFAVPAEEVQMPAPAAEIEIAEGPAQELDAVSVAVHAAKLCFSGKTHAGKDFVAKEIGATIFGFADPICDVLEYFFGTRERDIPGARPFMQAVGQWGRGEISELYPLTPERAMFIRAIREAASAGHLPDYVDWLAYGHNPNIWVEACLSRVATFAAENPTTRIAVTNVRFENELKLLREQGFNHFHVTCSGQTWQQRLAKDKIDPKSKMLDDASEALAKKFDAGVQRELSARPGGQRMRCIWNDTVRSPSPRLLSIATLGEEISKIELQ